jgi:hypothetical protein
VERWPDDDPDVNDQLAQDITFFEPFAAVDEEHSDSSSSGTVSDSIVSSNDDDVDLDEIEANVDESEGTADDDGIATPQLTCACSSNCMASLSSFPSVLRVAVLRVAQ